MRQLSVVEFKNAIEKNSIKTKLRYSGQQLLTSFFTEYSQNEIYQIIGDVNELRIIFGQNTEFFEKFGIYVSRKDIYTTDKQFIWFVNSQTSAELPDEYTRVCTEFGKAPSACVVNRANTQILNDLVTFCNQNTSNCTVWNYIDSTYASSLGKEQFRNNNFNYIDLTELFVSKCVTFSESTDMAYRNLVNLCEEIRKMPKAGIIYFIRHSSPFIRRTYSAIASILTYEGYNFEIEKQDESIMLMTYRDIFSRRYMMLGDYLNKLANPTDIGAYITGNKAYICVLDLERMKNFDITLRMLEVPVDYDTCSIRRKEATRIKCSYNDIEVLSIIDEFALDTDFETAKLNDDRLEVIIAELESIIDDMISLEDNRALNFTNVLLYVRDGVKYLGYVMDIEAEYAYAVFPLSNHYTMFREKFSISEYDNIMDISILSDADILVSKLRQRIPIEVLHFAKPKYTNGALMSAIKASTITLSSQSGLSFIEMGIWSQQASQCREAFEENLLKVFNRKVLRERKILTFWGGCHPGIYLNLFADSSVWR